MNVFDKNLLFEMSYALMRRFAFVEVTSPDEDAFHELLEGPGDIVRRAAAAAAASATSARRCTSTRPGTRPAGRPTGPPSPACCTRSSTRYFLPQFEGMDDERATTLYRTVAELLDPPEQAEAQRTIAEVLGVELRL